MPAPSRTKNSVVKASVKMELKNKCQRFVFLVSVLLMAACILPSGAVFAASSEITGYAWSENIGWVSSNCADRGVCAASNYVLTISDDTPNKAKISGYAWSENIGWMTFNESDLAGCPSAPCEASVDLTCPGGKCGVSGWARVLANGGGWDGWVKLGGVAADGSPYPLYAEASTGEFRGWAWSDMVLGWLSFNCADRGVCATSDYKLRTNFVFVRGPQAAMSCDSSQCSGGTCNPTTWVSYRPVADPNPCIYKIINESTDPDGIANIVKTEWTYKVVGADDSTYQTIPGCPDFAGISDCTLQSGIAAGEYTIRLKVIDASAIENSVTHDITIKAEVSAGFMCSLDNINWRDCGPLSGKIFKNSPVYFKDDPALAIHSVASEGETIINRVWLWNGAVIGGNTETESVIVVNKNNKIRLTVTDTGGRTDYLEYDLNSKVIPDWEE